MSEKIGQIPGEAQEFKAPDKSDGALQRETVYDAGGIEGEQPREKLDQLSLDAAIEGAKENMGEMSVEGAQLAAAYELGIPAEEFAAMNADERKKALQDALDHTDDKRLLTKLRSGATGKALKVIFAVGGVLMAGSAVAGETSPTSDTGAESSDDGDQEGEKMLHWPQIKDSIMKQLGTLHEMGITQAQGEQFLQAAVDSAQAVQDNRGSTDDALKKIEALFEQQYDTKFYENPENASQLKVYQMEAHNMMDKALIDNNWPATDKELFGFQGEAWEWGDYCVKNNASEDTFKQGMQDIFNRHFAKHISGGEGAAAPDTVPDEAGEPEATAETATEVPFEIKVKGFQSHANELMEKASIDFGKNVTDKQLNEFQTEAWSFADFCAKQNDVKDSEYRFGVKQLYDQHFSSHIEQQNQDRMERATGLAAELAPDALPDDSVMTSDWLRENVGKTFSRGDTLFAVAQGESQSMNISENKARLRGSALLTEMIAEARGNASEDRVYSEVVRHMGPGKTAYFQNAEGRYVTYLTMKVPLSDNIK
jgi:hypothetical protein